MVEFNGSSMMGVDPPPSAAAFKRAVLKFAPRVFSVEVLPPTKQGAAYSYGLRIFPATPAKSDSRSEHSDRSWTSDYEIWRRWEDCLHFQDILEEEYTQMAKDKRRRLKSGKGVKKDGVYVTSDFAASWDSLPAGPDYQDIAIDIHAYLPKLSKKGGLFRPNQTIIRQRDKDFEALIEALWMDDPPALIKELREMSKIRDFFGFWRRDQDRLRKLGLPELPLNGGDPQGTDTVTSGLGLASGPGNISRSSFFPSIFLRSRGRDDCESIRSSVAGGFLESIRSPSPIPSPLRPSAKTRDLDVGDTSSLVTLRTIQVTPMRFVLDSKDNLVDSPVNTTRREAPPRPPRLDLGETNSSYHFSQASRGPPSTSLPSDTLTLPSAPRRKRSGTFPSSRDNRGYRIFSDGANPAGADNDAQYIFTDSLVHRDDLLTPPPRSPYRQPCTKPFASISQVSVNTASSMASGANSPTIFSAVETSSSRPSSYQSITSNFRRLAARSMISLGTIRSDVPCDAIPSQQEDDLIISHPTHAGPLPEPNDLLESYFANMTLPSGIESRYSSGRESIAYQIPQPDRFPPPFQHRPPGQFHLPWSPTRPQPSPDYNRSSLGPPKYPPASTLSPIILIKAAYGHAVIGLKVERICSLLHLRQKIHEKFAKLDGVLLSECFILSYMNPKPPFLSSSSGRPRSHSTSIIATGSNNTGLDPSQLSFIVLEPEWRGVAKTCGPKLSLFLLEP